MNISFIKPGLILLLSLFFSFSIIAQQNHFIYLQTENKQPFYVKLDKKLISSSASGYLIIPKLQDGEYTLTVGFPKNEFAEQAINCTVNKKDAGYVLKNFGEKGWGLFNLQTMEVVMSGSKPMENIAVVETNKKADFSNTLSNVVKDPSIAKKEEEVKPVPAEVVKQPVAIPAKPKEEPAVLIPAEQITKLLSTKNAEGTELMYVDMINGIPDTIRMFIPAEKAMPEIAAEKKDKKTEIKIEPKAVPGIEESKPELKVEKKSAELTESVKAVPKPEIKNEEPAEKTPKFIDITLPNPNAKADTTEKLTASSSAAVKKEDVIIPVQDKAIENTAKPAVVTAEIVPEKKTDVVIVPEKPKENAKPVMMNSDCKAIAGEEDFLKLRKKMAAEDNDDDMLAAAKKIFKTKCFTTEQVKNLGVLFLKDEGKYKFFDLAYPFVSDSYNFGSLEAQLKDAYYIDRFKVMLRH